MDNESYIHKLASQLLVFVSDIYTFFIGNPDMDSYRKLVEYLKVGTWLIWYMTQDSKVIIWLLERVH